MQLVAKTELQRNLVEDGGRNEKDERSKKRGKRKEERKGKGVLRNWEVGEVGE